MKLSIHITPTTTLGELKNAFHIAYPQLKIELFSKAHAKGELLPLHDMLHQDHDTIADYLKNKHTSITLQIEPEHTVWETELLLEEKLYLHAQVFRKMGDTWIATSKTDKWTLAQQTARSLETMHPEHKEIIEEDYREHE